ncbi:uncharacterized protein LOC142165268 [Nicotiana tabacum]|uniref:Uncharacterized protein LOC142165268 n=1 Tax=Nicotiana tabacum TaxID=4097 RepID=A0AC58S4P3_TOBAC
MANRMKHCLNVIISEAQNAFIPGQLILDNAMISFEINHYLKRKTQGKTGFVALKTDMSKAYDRVEWDYLKNIMLKLCGLCFEGYEDEGLSALLRFYAQSGTLHDVKIAPHAPHVSHLFFVMMHHFSSRQWTMKQNSVASILNVRKVDQPGQYLGLPAIVGRSKKEIFNYIVVEVVRDLEFKGFHGSAFSKQRSEGGMGFQRLQHTNTALLAKTGWTILTRPCALVLESNSCPACLQYAESIMHILVMCNAAKLVWLKSSMGWRPVGTSFMEWFTALVPVTSKKLQEAIVLLWEIWNARNNLAWNGKIIRPKIVILRARRFWKEWISTRSDDNTLKCNIEASYDVNSGRAWAGMLIRDTPGNFVRGFSTPLEALHDAVMAEILTVREALS